MHGDGCTYKQLIRKEQGMNTTLLDTIIKMSPERQFTGFSTDWFGKNDPVAGPFPVFSRPLVGLPVLVQPDTVLVVIQNSGKRQIVTEGYQIVKLPAGPYSVYLVSTKHETLQLSNIEVFSADNWELQVSVSGKWRIIHPDKVTGIQDLRLTIERLCRDTIMQMLH